MTTVSVVIPHYGDPEPTLALCAQLAPQVGDLHELIVSDDCSPEPFPGTPGVRVVRREVNGGFGSTVNAGAAVATRDLLLILNSDLSVGPTFLADLVQAAAPWQPCVAGPRLVEPYGINVSARYFPLARHYVAEWLTPLARWHHLPAVNRALGQDYDAVHASHPSIVDWVVGAAMLIPRQAFATVGGFDEGFFMNVEEVDLQRRLRRIGVRAVHLPGIEVRHAGGGSSDPDKRARWVWGSRLRYARKWGGAGTLRLALTGATAVNLLWNAGRRIGGRPVAPVGEARRQLDLIWGHPE